MEKKLFILFFLPLFSIEIWAQCPIINFVDVATDGNCGGQATIAVSATDGDGGFSLLVYSIGGGYNDNLSGIFNDVVPGEYFLTVEDPVTGCITPYFANPIIIEESSFTINSISTIDPSDCGLSDGQITVFASTGSGGASRGFSVALQYSMDGPNGPWQNGNVFPGLSGGTYTVWVRNTEDGCVISESPIVLNEPEQAEINEVETTAVSACNASDGTLTIDASGGNGPLQYSINGQFGDYQDSNFFEGLSPGFYNVWVKNADGSCAIASNGSDFVPGDQPPIIFNVNFSDDTECLGNNGTIEIFAASSNGDELEYSITGIDGFFSSFNEFTGLGAGSYNVWVQYQDNSCPVNYGIITLEGLAGPQFITVSTQDSDACGANNGSITIGAVGGTIPRQYSITGPSGPWDTDNAFSGLGPGNYDIWIRNNDGTCPLNWGTETISEPPSPEFISVSVTDTECGQSNGEISISASGDNPIEYSISGQGGPWNDTGFFSGLTPGPYSNIYIRYQGGSCPTPYPFSVVVGSSAGPVVTNLSHTDVTSCGGNDGTITITAQLASESFLPVSFQYSITGPNGDWSNDNFFQGLSGGEYDIWVRLSNGTCPTDGGSVLIEEPTEPVITGVSTNDDSNCTIDNGTINIFAEGGQGTLQYSILGINGDWSNASARVLLSGGDYDIWVRNENGSCPVNWGTVTLNGTDQPTINNVITQNDTNCEIDNGSINIQASGGNGSYQYSITGPSGPWEDFPIFDNLAAGPYDIWVRNSNGSCSVNWGTEILQGVSQPFITNIITENVNDCGASDGSITILAQGGSG
ncbi:MAG: hypothetical protein AAGF87_14760, partial [Bacteroidota bacterium]